MHSTLDTYVIDLYVSTIYVENQYVYVIYILTVYVVFTIKRIRHNIDRVRCINLVVYVTLARLSTLILCSLRCDFYVIATYVVALYVVATYVEIMFSTLLHSTFKMIAVYVLWKCCIRWF